MGVASPGRLRSFDDFKPISQTPNGLNKSEVGHRLRAFPAFESNPIQRSHTKLTGSRRELVSLQKVSQNIQVLPLLQTTRRAQRHSLSDTNIQTLEAILPPVIEEARPRQSLVAAEIFTMAATACS